MNTNIRVVSAANLYPIYQKAAESFGGSVAVLVDNLEGKDNLSFEVPAGVGESGSVFMPVLPGQYGFEISGVEGPIFWEKAMNLERELSRVFGEKSK